MNSPPNNGENLLLYAKIDHELLTLELKRRQKLTGWI